MLPASPLQSQLVSLTSCSLAFPALSPGPLCVRFPLPANVDPDFIVPIWARNNNPGLPFSSVMSCWEPLWARLDVEQGGLRGAMHNPEGQDIRQVVSSAIHPENSSPMAWTLPCNDLVFVDCCPVGTLSPARVSTSSRPHAMPV